MLKGIAVSPGVVVARAYVIDSILVRREPQYLDTAALSEEITRFDQACQAAAQELDAIAMLSMEQNHDQAPDASPSRARGGRRGIHAGPVRDGGIHHRAPLRPVRDFA